MIYLNRAIGACLLLSAAQLSAQAAPAALMLHQGTTVAFKTETVLTSKTAHAGDRFELRSVEDVRIGTQIVIPAGSRGVGEVVTVIKKGAFGKSGKLDTRVLFAVVGDQRISMAGKSHEQGSGGTVGVVAAAVLLWPVMPFVTGKSAVFPAGTLMNGYVENDLPAALAAAAVVAPLVVPVAVTVPVAAAAAPIIPR